MSQKEEIMTAWNRNIPFFEYEIKPIVNGYPIKILEIGSYQGMSTRWMLENLLTHKDASITCVDIWDTTSQHQNTDFKCIEEQFDENISSYITKVTKLKGNSWERLLKLNLSKEEFNIIYIDGDHSAQGVLQDLMLSWPLLSKDGVIICDDYVWKENLEAWANGFRDYNSPLETPKIAIDSFTLIYSNKIRHWNSFYLCGSIAFAKVQ